MTADGWFGRFGAASNVPFPKILTPVALIDSKVLMLFESSLVDLKTAPFFITKEVLLAGDMYDAYSKSYPNATILPLVVSAVSRPSAVVASTAGTTFQMVRPSAAVPLGIEA